MPQNLTHQLIASHLDSPLRTVPRNFPGRSGTREDQVYLCSPETVTAAPLRGEITDPRDLGFDPPEVRPPETLRSVTHTILPPADREAARSIRVTKGPNIHTLPDLEPIRGGFEGPVLLKVEDDISTDEIMPAGSRVLPFRSNIAKLSEFVFIDVDDTFRGRSERYRDNGFVIVAGENYGQGSSREHAALAPRFLGLRAVVAKSFARIHRQNLINFGVVPLVFEDPDDHGRIDREDVLTLPGDLFADLRSTERIEVAMNGTEECIRLRHGLSPRQIDILETGSALAYAADRHGSKGGGETGKGGGPGGSSERKTSGSEPPERAASSLSPAAFHFRPPEEDRPLELSVRGAPVSTLQRKLVNLEESLVRSQGCLRFFIQHRIEEIAHWKPAR